MSENRNHSSPPESSLFPVVFLLLAAARILVSGTVYPWTAYLLAAALALLLLPEAWRNPEKISGLSPLLLAGLFLYFLAGAFSIHFSLVPSATRRWFAFQLGDLLLFLAALFLFPKGRSSLAVVLLGAGALSALFALRQRWGGFAVTMETENLTDFARQTIAQGRVFGLTFSPDMLAALLAGLLPLGFGLLLSLRHFPPSLRKNSAAVILAALLILFFSVLFLTRSVGGGLAAGAGLTVFGLLHLPGGMSAFRKLSARQAIFSAAVAVLFFIGIVAVIVSRGGHFLDLKNPDNPLFRRLDNWRTAAAVIREFPFTGTGGGQYGLAMLKHRSPAGNEARHVHNLALETLAETGPLGLLGLLLILFCFLRGIWNFWKTRDTAQPAAPDRAAPAEVRAGLLAGGAAVLLHSLIDFDWAVPEVSGIFWLALAGASLRRTTPSLSGRFPRFAFLLALLFTAGFEFYHMIAERRHRAAVEMAREKKWAEAKSWALAGLAVDPGRDDLYELLAHAELQLSPLPESRKNAAARLQNAIRLNPRYPYYYRNLALILQAEDPDKAQRLFQTAVALYPNSLELNLLLGRFLRKRGRPDEAEKILQHAVQCSTMNGDALLELAILRVQQGRSREAAELFRRAAMAFPFRGYRALTYAEFLVRLGQKNAAVDFLKNWIAEHPGHPEVAQGLEDILKKQ